MLNEPTLEKLRDLKLAAFAATWLAQQGDPTMGELSFDERLALLVDAEVMHRDNARLTRLLREAKLRYPSACVEDVDCAGGRGLERVVVRQLGTCRWVKEHHSLLIVGPTGTGKTYLGCAFGQQACRMGFRVLYKRVTRLFEELTLARADGSYGRLLDRLAKVDVLVLDDWGLSAIPAPSRQDLLEVIDDRSGQRSTVLTSQLPVRLWHDHIGDPTIADAICDRLLHSAHRIELRGPSRRKRNDAPVEAAVEAAT
jgi:DNA replication protein DnaC